MSLLVLTLLIGVVNADHIYPRTSPDHDHRRPTANNNQPAIKYEGPIVYSDEKPPIIHFPSPPRPNEGGNSLLRHHHQTSVKYVPLPHHDLPVLIYQSEKQPPIHVVHQPIHNKQVYSQEASPKQSVVPSSNALLYGQGKKHTLKKGRKPFGPQTKKETYRDNSSQSWLKNQGSKRDDKLSVGHFRQGNGKASANGHNYHQGKKAPHSYRHGGNKQVGHGANDKATLKYQGTNERSTVSHNSGFRQGGNQVHHGGVSNEHKYHVQGSHHSNDKSAIGHQRGKPLVHGPVLNDHKYHGHGADHKYHGQGGQSHGASSNDHKYHSQGSQSHGSSSNDHKYHGQGSQSHGTDHKYHGQGSHGTDHKYHGQGSQSHGTDHKYHSQASQSHGTDHKYHGQASQSHGTDHKYHGQASQSHGASSNDHKYHGQASQSHGTDHKYHGQGSHGTSSNDHKYHNQATGASQSHGTSSNDHKYLSQAASQSQRTSSNDHKFHGSQPHGSSSNDRKYNGQGSHATSSNDHKYHNQATGGSQSQRTSSNDHKFHGSQRTSTNDKTNHHKYQESVAQRPNNDHQYPPTVITNDKTAFRQATPANDKLAIAHHRYQGNNQVVHHQRTNNNTTPITKPSFGPQKNVVNPFTSSVKSQYGPVYIKAPQAPIPVYIKNPSKPIYAQPKDIKSTTTTTTATTTTTTKSTTTQSVQIKEVIGIIKSSSNKTKIYPKSSYVPPKPTYKPKPTRLPKPKPVYKPSPAAPHIIYAGHPPIHIYEQPTTSRATETIERSEEVTPPTKYQKKLNYSAKSPNSRQIIDRHRYNNAHRKEAQASSGNNPVYIPAPKAFHKPPIIIYQGFVPPVHVFKEAASPRLDVSNRSFKRGIVEDIASS